MFLIYFRQRVETFLQILVCRNIVAHIAREILGIGFHVKITRTGQAEENCLCLACFFAFQRFVYCAFDSVRRFGSRLKIVFVFSELNCGVKHFRLFIRYRFHISVVIKFGQYRRHTVVSQTACMVCGRNKSAAQSIHFCKRSNFAGIAENHTHTCLL